MPPLDNQDDLDRPVWGIRAIAAVINREPRATQHLFEKGALPVRMVGRRYVSTPRALRAALTPVDPEIPE